MNKPRLGIQATFFIVACISAFETYILANTFKHAATVENLDTLLIFGYITLLFTLLLGCFIMRPSASDMIKLCIPTIILGLLIFNHLLGHSIFFVISH